MELDGKTVWSLVVTGLMMPLAWFLRGSIEKGNANEKAIGDLRVEMHRDFATQAHVQTGSARLEERLDRIEDKLDRLLTKGITT